MSIKLKLEGFTELIKEIEKAQGNVDKATTKALEKSAKIMEDELKSQMQKADSTGNMSRLISRMPSYEIENDHGYITARVGYKMDDYNPRNISDGYKAVFINYGTPHRMKHRQIKARNFIAKAKRIAKPKIVKIQEETLQEILKGLKR